MHKNYKIIELLEPLHEAKSAAHFDRYKPFWDEATGKNGGKQT